ncbi:hypothetical protein GQX74_005622 [Glossina fuscipes]|nr:hypothetical protein GQX74_005622 [Glossina fuscipes]
MKGYAACVDPGGINICSVDPPGCTDIDYGLHCRELLNGNLEVGVHIDDKETLEALLRLSIIDKLKPGSLESGKENKKKDKPFDVGVDVAMFDGSKSVVTFVHTRRNAPWRVKNKLIDCSTDGRVYN